MVLSIKIKNKRRWQEIGVAIVLTVLMAVPTMAMVAYIPMWSGNGSSSTSSTAPAGPTR